VLRKGEILAPFLRRAHDAPAIQTPVFSVWRRSLPKRAGVDMQFWNEWFSIHALLFVLRQPYIHRIDNAHRMEQSA
jgi:hypothetical protein